MARHGENIRKRKDGRWEGRYAVYSKEKNRKIYLSVYGKSYDEAKEKLTMKKNLSEKPEEAVLTETNRESSPPADMDIYFRDAAKKWLEKIKRENKPSTYVKYTQIYKNHIREPFRDDLVSDLTNASVRAKIFQAGGEAGGLSDSILKSIYCVLNQVLKYASESCPLPFPTLKRPSSGTCARPVQTLSGKEQIKLFSALYHNMDMPKLAVLLCLYTGLRLGELCALKWSDIDSKNRILTVSRTVQRLYAENHKTKTVLLETEPKSLYSRREIPLSGPVAALLLQFQNGGEYVFGKDKPLEPRTMQNHFKKILKEAGLPDRNFHILRHTFATNCVEKGTDVKSLSEMLGHSDVRITLNRYVHPSMDAKRRYLETLDGFYGQIYGQAV